MADDSIFIYQTTTMSMLEDETGQKRPLKIENLADFSWSPTSNIISAYIKENSKKPALIKLILIPSKELLASRTIFDARACTFFWQSEGEYLLSSIRTQDTTKIKKTIFEVMCLSIKNIPTFSFILNKPIISCAWQNSTNRFAVIYEKDAHKKFLAVYEVDLKKEIIPVGEKETIMNEILWAPQGNHLLLFSKEKNKFVFYSISEKGLIDIEERTYANLNYLEWDPSGRYLIVAKTLELKSTQSQLQGAGYAVYNGQGEIIYQFPIEKFFQIL